MWVSKHDPNKYTQKNPPKQQCSVFIAITIALPKQNVNSNKFNARFMFVLFKIFSTAAPFSQNNMQSDKCTIRPCSNKINVCVHIDKSNLEKTSKRSSINNIAGAKQIPEPFDTRKHCPSPQRLCFRLMHQLVRGTRRPQTHSRLLLE